MALEYGGNVKRTFCSVCPAQCVVLVEVKDGKATRIEGYKDSPTRGNFCIKGATSLQYHNSPDRLNYPLKRVGPRGGNKWEQISWKQALDEIAEKLAKLRDTDGPEALATLGGTHQGPGDWANWRFSVRYGTPNFILQGRNCGVGEFATEVAMFGWGTKIGMPVPGVTKCAFIWGGAFQGGGPGPIQMFKAMKEAGMKLVVVDPRRIKIAEFADLHLKLKPRTDGALLMAMIHIAIKEGLYDKEFVERWTTGFEEVRKAVADWTPERAAKICDLRAEDIVTAARWYCGVRPSRITTGVALTEAGQGAAFSSIIGMDILRAISGNLDVVGGEPLGGPYDPNQFAWLKNIGFDRMFDHPLRKRDSVNADYTPFVSVRGYKASREAMAKVYPEGYTACAYQLYADPAAVYKAVLEKKPYPIKAIICQGGSPMQTMGGGKAAFEAFTSPNLELSVVVDHWMHPTAQLADYVLPAADFLERPDTSTRLGCLNTFTVGQQCVEPQFERKDDYWFWAQLARRLGQDPAEWPETLVEMHDIFLKPSGKTYHEWAHADVYWNGAKIASKKYEKTGFATASGKVELVPQLFERLGMEAVIDYKGPGSPGCLPDVDDEAAYPLIMIPGSRRVEFTAARTHAVESLKKLYPDPCVLIHPDTAAAYGIKEGEWVHIDRPEGSVRQKAKITDVVRPDTIDPDGFWWEPKKERGLPGLSGGIEHNINFITPSDTRMSSFAGDQMLRGMRCQIRKAA